MTSVIFTEADVRAFVEIAHQKQLSLLLDRTPTPEPVVLWGVDMDLVRASVQNALDRAKMRSLEPLATRLDRLLNNATSVQQVEFVLGSQRTYYFPDDIERMALAGKEAEFPYTIHELSWLRCRPVKTATYRVEEHQTRICVIEEAL